MKFSSTILINLTIVSIIPFLILGPFFPDLIVSFSALFFLYYVFKNKKFVYFGNKPLIIFFIFCIYCVLLSIFVAEETMLSFESSLFYFRIGVFSCLIWYLIDKSESIFIYFYYTLIICFSVLVIDGYYQHFIGENIIGLRKIPLRISSFFGNELIMGSYLSRLFPLLFALFIVKKKQKFEIYYIGFLFVLVDLLIYLSGERSAFFFLNLSTIFIIILIKEYQKFRLLTFIVAFIGIFLMTLTNPNLSDRMFKSPTKNINLLKSSDSTIIFTEAHDSLFRTAFNMFKDKPLFGHGPKMFRVKCNVKSYQEGIKPCDTHPHNFYLQLLAETGIIGFLFLFSFFIYVLYMSLRQFISIIFNQKRYLTDYQVCLLSGVLITVWPVTTNGNFFNNWLMIVYCLPIGFYLQSIYCKKNSK
tara:strand:+ start:4722 stop:5966 length:1245 start_codon:yes stop_codon:yes gene_type:complete